jgi:hypothetical protein
MTLPAGLWALVLATAMWGMYGLGYRLGTRWPHLGKAPPSRLDGTTLATLGLLLAFTFSLALAQHNQRRERAIDDANAIGNLYTCASLLEEPVRARLQDVVHRYLEARVQLGHSRGNEAALARELPLLRQMQAEMTALVREAVRLKTPIVTPLVNSLNQVTSSHTARLAAIHYRLPWSILSLLGLAAIVSMLIVGTQQGAVTEHNLVPIAVFIALVAAVVWVILQLNQPGRGLIVVSQEPLERLLATMTR